MKRCLLILGALLIAGSFAPAAEVAARKIRSSAVAGLFYPRDPTELARAIDAGLAGAKPLSPPPGGTLKALIVPHAGYAYSGPIAATGFALLRGKKFETVVILAPSHYASLSAASVTDADVFRTPLGDVPISQKRLTLAQQPPFALAPRCFVQTPEWADQSSHPRPAAGAERADTWEHADEVEVPFLQRTLRQFSILPVVCGDIDPAKAAQSLLRVVDDRTLIIASSDLSHYHPYEEARKLDRRCVDAVCALDLAKTSQQEACGIMPILTLMNIAKQRGWQPVLLDYRNSGDTAGDKSRVVGYAVIAFYAPAAAANALSDTDRTFLLGLARRTVREVTTTGRLPEIPAQELTPNLTVPRACFVTLNEHGELRGCIGHLTAQMPLYRAVIDNARNAAIYDNRFPRVSPKEVDALEIEISVLTEPEPLAFTSPEDLLAKLQPHRDGVVLRIDRHSATYLPQVWEQLPDKREFLDSLALKAGVRASDWRKPGTTVSIYHVESFKENRR